MLLFSSDQELFEYAKGVKFLVHCLFPTRPEIICYVNISTKKIVILHLLFKFLIFQGLFAQVLFELQLFNKQKLVETSFCV